MYQGNTNFARTLTAAFGATLVSIAFVGAAVAPARAAETERVQIATAVVEGQPRQG